MRARVGDGVRLFGAGREYEAVVMRHRRARGDCSHRVGTAGAPGDARSPCGLACRGSRATTSKRRCRSSPNSGARGMCISSMCDARWRRVVTRASNACAASRWRRANNAGGPMCPSFQGRLRPGGGGARRPRVAALHPPVRGRARGLAQRCGQAGASRSRARLRC